MKLPSRLASLLRELRRRRVLQAAAVYATGAFVAVQVAALVFPALGFAPLFRGRRGAGRPRA